MFNIKENLQTLIIVALGTALVLMYFITAGLLESKDDEIATLRDDLSVCRDKKAGLEISNLGLNNIIADTNLKIEALAVDYDNAVAYYTTQLKKPPEVRYEVIYKYVDKEIIKSEECNDIKDVLNSLSNIDYNDL